MLAYYVEWHMRSILATLLFDDEQQLCSQLQNDSPVAPALSSPKALRKTHSKRTEDNFPVHSFGTILADLATIVKNRVQPKLSKVEVSFDKITCPTPLQQKALDLLGVRL
jgi:hypothetical protein